MNFTAAYLTSTIDGVDTCAIKGDPCTTVAAFGTGTGGVGTYILSVVQPTTATKQPITAIDDVGFWPSVDSYIIGNTLYDNGKTAAVHARLTP